MGTPIHSPNTSYQIIPPLSLQPTQELMQILQFHPILNHSSSDIPTTAASFSTEFEGGCIAHAAGAGNGGHSCIVTANDDFDAQPAAVVISSRIQIFEAAVFLQCMG